MNIVHEFDTIAAIATPAGTGGVAIVRISGEKSFEIIKAIFRGTEIEPGRIAHGWLGELDEVIVLPFKAPNSYTGEDVIEIQCHGGVNVVKSILELVLRHGARAAQRGEFTKRAFVNGKLDLSQAESVADLIHARTKTFARESARNLSGILAREIKKIRGIIFELLSQIVAGIDFPDDVAEPEYKHIATQVQNAIVQVDKILACAKSSNIMRQGIKVAIAGEPNVGKSSIFNALLNMERAIVTEIAGTTRDVLNETLDWDVAVTLTDTAGIRDAADKVEQIGIEYSKQSVDEADLVLLVYDASKGFDEAVFELVKNKPHIVVANKCDLCEPTQGLALSALTGRGFDELKTKIKEFTSGFSEDTEFVTNTRQQDCLEKSRAALVQALAAAEAGELQDLISIDLKSALLHLDEITGEVITDDILNNIFENFCIGK
jgi:tRNA modification GTPase